MTRFTQRPQDIAADHAEALAIAARPWNNAEWRQVHAPSVARRWHRGTLTGHAAVAMLRTSEELLTDIDAAIALLPHCCGHDVAAHQGPLGCALCNCAARPILAAA